MSLPDLPSELVVLILASAATLSDLRALAATSQRFYAIFEADREALIYQAFANELGPVFDDALALSHLQLLDPRKPGYFGGDYRAALAKYGGYLENHGHPSPRQLSLEDVLGLVRTYRTMSELSKTYMASTIKLIERMALPSCTPRKRAALMAPPSRSESLRVLRAHYRLQMVLSSYLAGNWTSPQGGMGKSERSLFPLWRPWEVQQIFCVGGFYKRLEEKFTELPNGHMHSERLADKVTPLLDWAEYIKETRATDEAGWQTVLDKASGIPLAHMASNRHRLIVLSLGIQELASLRWHLLFSGEPVRLNELARRHRFPAHLRFVGDRVAAVPLAWADAFDGYYGYHYWGVMPGNTQGAGGNAQGLWSVFGFVLWDAPRVQALKTASILSCCETGWLS